MDASCQAAQLALTGTANQIEWAEQIRRSVILEFDRVARALRATAETRTGQGQKIAQLALEILSDKRVAVLANERAGYFIRDWQESDGKVRLLITQDPRYAAIRASRVAPWFSMDPQPANTAMQSAPPAEIPGPKGRDDEYNP